jgi:putative transposase
MKRARFTDEQIIGVLKEREAGAKTADLARKHGVSEATLYNGKAKYGGLDVSEAKRLKQLEDENAKLKTLLAGQMLDAAALPRASRKKMVGPAAKREGVAHLTGRDGPFGTAGLLPCRRGSQDDPLPLTTRAGHGTSDAIARSRQRTAALRLSTPVHPAAPGRRTVRDQPHRPALSRRRPDGGKRRGRRRVAGTRAPILFEAAANAGWCLDVHDQLACGRRFRILNIVDDVTRECLAAIPDTSISGRRVARERTVLIERRGKPGMIVSDNGTEFTSNAMLAWTQDNRIVWHCAGKADAERLL